MPMPKLAPLLLLVLAAPACVMDANDDSVFFVEWSLEDVGPGTDVLGCDEMDVTTVRVQARNVATNTAYEFPFPCSDGGGFTSTLPAGPYAITVSLLTSAGLSVSSIDLEGSISRRRRTELAVIFELQSFEFSWQITSASGAPLTCEQVGATTVSFVAQTTGVPPQEFPFPCNLYQGLSPAVLDGTYTLAARLSNGAGQVLSERVTSYTTPLRSLAQPGTVTFSVN